MIVELKFFNVKKKKTSTVGKKKTLKLVGCENKTYGNMNSIKMQNLKKIKYNKKLL